jgi:hypothetical protein
MRVRLELHPSHRRPDEAIPFEEQWNRLLMVGGDHPEQGGTGAIEFEWPPLCPLPAVGEGLEYQELSLIVKTRDWILRRDGARSRAVVVLQV